MAKRVRLRTREAIIHFHGHEIARFIFYTYTPRMETRATAKTSYRNWLKFGYVIVRPRYSGGRDHQIQNRSGQFFATGGKRFDSGHFGHIFFWKIHHKSKLGLGTLKFGMNIPVKCI